MTIEAALALRSYSEKTMETTTLIDQLKKHLPTNFEAEKKEDDILIYIGDMVITLTSDDTHFIFSSPIGPLPAHADKELLFQNLGSANFLRHSTGNAYLNFNLEDQKLYLFAATSIHTPLEGVQETLEVFCNYVDYWKNAMRNYK